MCTVIDYSNYQNLYNLRIYNFAIVFNAQSLWNRPVTYRILLLATTFGTLAKVLTLRYFLGLEIAKAADGISLSQRKYTLSLLSDTSFIDSKPAALPMDRS